ERLAGTAPPRPSAEAVAARAPAGAGVAPSTGTRPGASPKDDLPRNGVSAAVSVGQQRVQTIRETERRLSDSPTAPEPTTDAPPAPASTDCSFRDHAADHNTSVPRPGAAPAPRSGRLELTTDADTEVQPLPPARGRRRWALPELRWIILSL